MPFKIQRVPRGLLDLLNINGGLTPTELEDRVGAVVDLFQSYGLQQETILSNNTAALTEGTAVQIVLPSETAWMVLFDASFTVIKTGTMTALRSAIFARIGGLATAEYALAAEEMGPYGATETGAATICYQPPYPRLLSPGTRIGGRMQILGTDANANCTIGAHIGILG